MKNAAWLKDPGLHRPVALTGGKWVPGSTTLEVTDPVMAEVIGVVPDITADQTRQAIAAAETALKTVRKIYVIVG